MKRHALVVGINQYSDDTISALNCARKDAQDIEYFLRQKCKFDLVRCLLDKQAEGRKIVEEINKISTGLTEGDLLFFFFAGHGYENHDQGQLLLGADCQRYLLSAGMLEGVVPLKTIETLTARTGAGRLLVLDACRERLEEGKRAAGGGLDEVTKRDIGAVVESAEGNPPLCVVYSCDTGQLACEIKDEQSGVFTRALCNVMANRIETRTDLLLPRDFNVLITETHRLLGEYLPNERQDPWCKANRGDILVIGAGADSVAAELEYKKVLQTFLEETRGEWTNDDLRDLVEDIREAKLGTVKRYREVRKDAETLRGEWVAAGRISMPASAAEDYKDRIAYPPIPPPPPGPRDRLIEWGLESVRAVPAKLDCLAPGSHEAQEAQLDAKKKYVHPLPLATRCQSTHMEFRLVPAGTCVVGSPENEASRGEAEEQHEVTVYHPLYVGTFPVTQKQWESVMGANPSVFPNAGAHAPVENVTWEQCQNFLTFLCERAGVANGTFRLLTSDEWEYACRAGTSSPLYTGELDIAGLNDAPALDRIGWYAGNCSVSYEGGHDSSSWPNKQKRHKKAGTHPVGRKTPNAWGLCDMIGNVWEWCSDEMGDGTAHTVRGGSWFCNAMFCRAACKMVGEARFSSKDVGLRVAIEAPR